MKSGRKRDFHLLNIDGMVLCNPRDKEAAHRAAMGEILIAEDAVDATCMKCLEEYAWINDICPTCGAKGCYSDCIYGK
jgi:hypothetical protein